MSTANLAIAAVALGLMAIAAWGPHDGGIPGVLAFMVFPVAALVAFVSSLLNLRRSKVTSNMVEFGLAFGFAMPALAVIL